MAFSIALWTSIFVYWFHAAAEERQQYQYHQPVYQGSVIDYFVRHVWKGCSLFPNPIVNFDWHIDPGGVSHLGSRVARVLRSLSPDSLANLVANVVPGQDIHRIGSGGSIIFTFSIIAMSNIQKYTSLDHFGCLQL